MRRARPDHARDQLSVELEEGRQAVTIVERRPLSREDYRPEWTRSPIARLRYTRSTRLWTLCYHRDTRRWERYPLLDPTRRIDELLDEIDRDPICISSGADEPRKVPSRNGGFGAGTGTRVAAGRVSWSGSELRRS